MEHRPHGIVEGLINQNFEFVLFWRVHKCQVGHLHVDTDARERARRTGSRRGYQRWDMKEDVPWRKGVTCWRNSEHPSVRIKDKVSHRPRCLGDVSPSETRAFFILNAHFYLKQWDLVCTTGHINSAKPKRYSRVTRQVGTSTIYPSERPFTPLPGSHFHTERFINVCADVRIIASAPPANTPKSLCDKRRQWKWEFSLVRPTRT